MEFDLAILEKAREEHSIKNTRVLLNDFIEYMLKQPFQADIVSGYAKLRDLKVETIIDHGGFMIPEDFTIARIPDPWKEARFGLVVNRFLVYSGRFCFPVMEPGGLLPMGIVGYDKFDDIKYRDSKTFGYKAKQNSLWGMEKLPEYYDSDKPVFITEGLVCAMWLRENGFQSLAFLGSSASPYIKILLSRFKRPVWVPDSDEAGFRFMSYNRSEVFYRPPLILGKDLDDARKKDPVKLIEDLRKYEKEVYVT